MITQQEVYLSASMLEIELSADTGDLLIQM